MKCKRCRASGADKMFLALGYAAGDDEGEHVADVDAPLCPACIEIVEDLMLAAMGFSASASAKSALATK